MASKKFPYRTAVILCNGGCAAKQDENGEKLCKQGCIDCGKCIETCRLKAIERNENGVPEINSDKCVACGLCVKNCPQNLIVVRELGFRFAALCSNTQMGKEARAVCDNSCIACGICVKKCPAAAISIVDNHAVIDFDECLNCGACAANCPRGVIRDFEGVLTK